MREIKRSDQVRACCGHSKPIIMIPKRLLRVHSRVLVDTHSLDGEDIEYTAISHAWGTNLRAVDTRIRNVCWPVYVDDPDKVNNIICMAVSKKIEWLWMDIICINQQDDNDKNCQIPMMRYYFSDCKQCIIVANGMMTDDFSILKRESIEVIPLWPNYMRPPYTFLDSQTSTMHITNSCDLILEVLIRISEVDAFCRVWTLQESALPVNALIWNTNGDDVMLSVDDLYSYWVIAVAIYKNSSHIHSIDQICSFKNKMHNILSVRNINSCTAGIALHHALERKATIDCDNVYGILGLLEYGHLVNITYNSIEHASKSLMQIAIENADMSLLFSGITDICTVYGNVARIAFSDAGGTKMVHPGKIEDRKIMIKAVICADIQSCVNLKIPEITSFELDHAHLLSRLLQQKYFCSLITTLVKMDYECDECIKATGIKFFNHYDGENFAKNAMLILIEIIASGYHDDINDSIEKLRRRCIFYPHFDPIEEALVASRKVDEKLKVIFAGKHESVLCMLECKTDGTVKCTLTSLSCNIESLVEFTLNKATKIAFLNTIHKDITLLLPCLSVDDNATHEIHSDSDDDTDTEGSDMYEYHAFTRVVVVNKETHTYIGHGVFFDSVNLEKNSIEETYICM